MRVGLQLFACALLQLAIPATMAEPVIAIIIDDLGYRHADGYRAIKLPGSVACAVIPRSPYATDMALAAHKRGKEVLLHLPMQSTDHERAVGDEGITIDTTETGVSNLLAAGLEDVPHAVGVNNHMGSLITRHPGHMAWLMKQLRTQQLFFVDSVTTGSSVALSTALEHGVSATARDIFLDRENASKEEITAQLRRAIRLAREQGHALAIGHPYPETMAVLEHELHRRESWGVRLVTVRELIDKRSSEKLVAKAQISTH